MNTIQNYRMTNYQTNFCGNKQTLNGIVQKIELCKTNNNINGAINYTEQLRRSFIRLLLGIV